MPVPGTITPEPEPVEAVSDAALPLPSTTEMWVVPRCSSGSRRRIRCAVSRRASLVEEPAGEAAAVELTREGAAAGRLLLAHQLDELRDRLSAPGRPSRAAEPVEQPGAEADQHAARRRRGIRLEVVPEEARADRLAPDHAVLGEVAQREVAAVLAHVPYERAGELAAVEVVRARVGQALERPGEVGHHEAVAGDERRVVPAVDLPALVGMPQDQVEDARAGTPATRSSPRPRARPRSPARAGRARAATRTACAPRRGRRPRPEPRTRRRRCERPATTRA